MFTVITRYNIPYNISIIIINTAHAQCIYTIYPSLFYVELAFRLGWAVPGLPQKINRIGYSFSMVSAHFSTSKNNVDF